MTFQVSSPTALSWRCWDGDYIVYNPLSGNTHKLDLLTGEICLFLSDERRDLSEIYGFAADFLGIDVSEDLQNSVDASLQALDEAGLIESPDP
ncbi:MAG: HPr-rel-A system PqqD family peptide chaperone [Kiloniellales bacterium]|nr:HPr-rel-A system PqqD family peptide chaperone [Kiloniellales bacterium]